MTGVIGLGRRTGQFLDLPVHAVHIDPSPVLSDLVALHRLLMEVHADHGPLVVVYPDRLGDAAARALGTVRAAMAGPPVLWYATRLPPLAADVLLTLAAALRTELGGAAAVATALPLLERQVVHLTWLPSVARLGDPAPTVWQHARSALPGTSWVVASWPEPTIHRLGDGPLPPVPRAAQPVGIALADLDGDRSWVDPTVARTLPEAVGVEVPPPPDTADWWSSRRVTQVVLYPRDVGVVADALRPHLDPGSCAWCHRQVASPMCPWCRLPRNGLATTDGTAPAVDEVMQP